jgi:TPR repeat protein
VPQDAGEAITWFRKAADRGHPLAQYNLARSHIEGKAVENDLVEAYKWLILASDQGDRDARRDRIEVGLQISASDMAEAIRRAHAFSTRLRASMTNSPPGTSTNQSAALPP